ncbi:DNA helicase IV [Ilumatobacter fluminis]|uniref:DNA helicase IV n=1 Tax=Ilumatobacter fluminis TaxID=467091 RepID=A0A4R7HWK7_9ACTN|nr:AAA family ATPase [Ilumatobacter fluminis]TDT15401.1 DNA helicase IV [Ilumatobacter fluminis]
MSTESFPELEFERARLTRARACRDSMIDRLGTVDPSSAADEITSEYIEMTVWEALDSLRSPGAGDFFGRIDEPSPTTGESEEWYIGRRHIEDERGDPVVVDWRAPISAPFYRATAIDPLGVTFRRRFTLSEGEMTAYLDEHLDDPDADGSVAAGIPDPVLAEIGAERSGAMREIVATIQGEQDIVIRADIDQALIVQGGPGTGKTAVALHRAAFLLFEHRARLARDGVLVVGPNQAFLDYISNVLPSLGEKAVRQCTALDLCIPKVEVTGIDEPEAARWKGSAERLAEIEERALAAIQPPDDDVVVPLGARKFTFEASLIAEWIETAKDGIVPINQRRERLRVLAQQELRRRCNGDDRWREAGPLKTALNKCWPTQKPVKLVDQYLDGPRGKKRAWTPADQFLVDEANTLLNGTPFTYAHVVVDEAQDQSAVALRVIGRRSPAGSLTLVGDVAQSTTPAGQERWADVFAHLGSGRSGAGVDGTIADLTIGYRVPEPILTVANRLLPLTGVDATPSRSVRVDGEAPSWRHTSPDELPSAVAATVRDVKHRHRLTGLVAPVELHDSIGAALAEVGLVAVDHVHELGHDDVPIFTAEAVKGLEFDGVVVAEPHTILDATPATRGARLLYVAMTRAVQELAFVTSGDKPAVIDVG